jgi:hypothetical protein
MTACLAEPAIDHRPAPRTSLVDEPDEVAEPEVEPRFQRALRGYLDAVARKLGVGLESCTLDKDLPTSAYLAVDRRLPEFPDRDLAMLWDEVHGWAVAIETHSGEDLIVVSYLDTDTVTPPPGLVARFLHEVTDGRSRLGRPEPAVQRVAGEHQNLIRDLESATQSALVGSTAGQGDR